MAKKMTARKGSKASEARPAKASCPVDSGSGDQVFQHERIAQLAREIWEAKGCPVGQDMQNWQEAEAQLRAELG